MYNKLIILMTPALLRRFTSNTFCPTAINIYEDVVTSSFTSSDANKDLYTNQYSQLQIFLFSKQRHCTPDFLDFSYFTIAKHLSMVPL